MSAHAPYFLSPRVSLTHCSKRGLRLHEISQTHKNLSVIHTIVHTYFQSPIPSLQSVKIRQGLVEQSPQKLFEIHLWNRTISKLPHQPRHRPKPYPPQNYGAWLGVNIDSKFSLSHEGGRVCKLLLTPVVELSKLPVRPPTKPTSPIAFFHFLERLKTTKREGWRRFGLCTAESISDHMYRMSIMTMLAPPSLASRLNVPHCTKMALVHDMAESLVGDITPVDGVPVPEKHRREAVTMDFLTEILLGQSSGFFKQGGEIREIWQEYEASKTLEAVFVHDIDKIELLLQAIEYERSNEGKVDLSEFLSVAENIQLQEVKVWCDEILHERNEYWKALASQVGGIDAKPTSLAKPQQ